MSIKHTVSKRTACNLVNRLLATLCAIQLVFLLVPTGVSFADTSDVNQKDDTVLSEVSEPAGQISETVELAASDTTSSVVSAHEQVYDTVSLTEASVSLSASASSESETRAMLASSSSWYKGTTEKSTITQIDIKDNYMPDSYDERWDASDSSVPGTVTAYVEGSKLTLTRNAPMLAESNTWYKGTTSKDTITEIDVVDYYTPSGTVTETWDASDPSVPGTVTAYLEDDGSGNGTYKITLSGNGYGKIYMNSNSYQAFSQYGYGQVRFTALTTFNGANILDTSKVEDMSCLFYYCEKLTGIDVSNWDTSNVIYMDGLFARCYALATPDVSKWETGKVTDMSGLFSHCEAFTTVAIDNWDTSQVEDMDGMFDGCINLCSLNVANWDMGKVEYMLQTFLNCQSLTSLDVSKWTFNNLQSLYSTFSNCTSLTSLAVDNWNTSTVTSTTGTFSGCTSLQSIDISQWDMSNNNGKYGGSPAMFRDCTSLKSLTIPASLTTFGKQFAYNCTSLTEITFLHEADAAVTMPTAGSNQGAFYVPSYLETTITTSNSTIDNYDWVTDNRRTIPVPMLKMRNNWYTGTTDIGTITEIEVVDTYTPSATVTESWDASDDSVPGTVTAYVEGTKLTLSGNGSGFIYANPDSNNAFSDFTGVTSIKGTSLIDTSKVTKMECMFENCSALASLDVSSWDTSNVTNMRYVFSNCRALTTLKGVDAWDVSNVTDMNYMFQDCWGLTSLDLNQWATSNVKKMYMMFQNCKTLTSLNVSKWDTSNVTDMACMFDGCLVLPTLDVGLWDLSNVTSTLSMFDCCYELVSLDVSKWNVSNVRSMHRMFYNCYLLDGLNVSNWNVSNVGNFGSMFMWCKSMTSLDVSKWDTSSARTFESMFQYCKSLTELDVSGWKTSNVTTMHSLLHGCNSMTTFDVSGWDTSNVESISYMFYGCSGLSTLDVSRWKTSNVTDMQCLFYECEKLKEPDVSGWDTSNVTNMSCLFYGCNTLVSPTKFNNWNTSAVTDMSEMFSCCNKLTSIDITGWDLSAVTNSKEMFYECSKLESLTIPSSLNVLDKGFAGNCSLLTNIVFLHSASSSISLPTAGWASGAFYSSGTIETTVTTNNDTVKSYDWAADERAVTFVTAASNSLSERNSVLSEAANAQSENVVTDSELTIDDGAEETTDTTDAMPSEITSESEPAQDASSNQAVSLAAEGLDTEELPVQLAIRDLNPVGTQAITQLAVYRPNAIASTAGTSLVQNDLAVAQTADTVVTASNDADFWMIKANADSSDAFAYFTSLTAINGLDHLDTSNTTTFDELFKGCSALTSLAGLESLETGKVTRFSSAFADCGALPSVDVSSWDWSSVESTSFMFDNCTSLATIKLPTSKAPKLYMATQMFNQCQVLESLDVSCFANGKLKYADSFLQRCYSLKTLTGYEALVTSVTERMSTFFNGCCSLTSLNLSQWDTRNAESFYALFSGCNSLTSLKGLENWDTGNVYDMQAVFHGVEKLTTIDGITNWNVTKSEEFDDAFADCTALTSLDISGWNTDVGWDFKRMFSACENLKVLDISGLNTKSATTMTDMFKGMKRLQQVTLGENFTFTGDGTTSCVLPTPSATYIPGATGQWQAVADGTVDAPMGTIYDPADVPNNVAETYVMPNATLSVDVPVKVLIGMKATGEWITPTASKNTLINHSNFPAHVTSATTQSASDFTLRTATEAASSTESNVFGGTIKAGSSTAQDLSSVNTTGDAWTMAAGNVSDEGNLIPLQLAGNLTNVNQHYFIYPVQVFTMQYTFELVL